MEFDRMLWLNFIISIFIKSLLRNLISIIYVVYARDVFSRKTYGPGEIRTSNHAICGYLLYQSIWTSRLSCQMVELEVSLFFRVCTVSMLIELILHYTMKYCCKLSFIKIISIKYILTIYKHYQETFCFCFGASETSPTNGSIRE